MNMSSTPSSPFAPSLSKLSSSLAPYPSQIHQACVITILRVIDNILADPSHSNVKLRKIKVANPAFWKRAGQWDGCIPFLIQCGFTALGEGGNGVPLHLKFENECEARREILIGGRQELVKFAVEGLQLQGHMLPVCPVQSQVNVAAAECNSFKEVSLLAKETPVSSAVSIQQKSPSNNTCPSTGDKIDKPNVSSNGPAADSDIIDSPTLSLNASSSNDQSVLKGEAASPTCQVQTVEVLKVNVQPEICEPPCVEKLKEAEAVPPESKVDINSTASESKLKIEATAPESKTAKQICNLAAPKFTTKTSRNLKPQQSANVMPSEADHTSHELNHPKMQSTDKVTENNRISPQAKVASQSIAEQTGEKMSPAESDEMTDLLAEIENELNDDGPILSQGSDDQTTTCESIFLLEDKGHGVGNSSSNEIVLDTNKEAAAVVRDTNTFVEDNIGKDDPSLQTQRLAVEKTEFDRCTDTVDTTKSTAAIIEGTANQNVASTEAAQDEVELMAIDTKTMYDYREVIMESFLDAPDENSMNQKSKESLSEESESPMSATASNNVITDPDQHTIYESTGGENINILSDEHLPSVAASVNQQNSISEDDCKELGELEKSQHPVQESTPCHLDVNTTYNLLLHNIPLSEGEFSSSDDDEAKAFLLGFELCHRMLILIWNTEDSLWKETHSMAKTQNVTAGLTNVKPWTQCSTKESSDKKTRTEEGGSNKHYDTEPALIVPLSFVYEAWAYLLNAKNDSSTRSRTMYSWIVSNHPELSTLSDIPVSTSALFTNVCEEDAAICNYVCNSLCKCGLATVYGADVVTSTDGVSSDLSFFIGIEHSVLKNCVAGESILLDKQLVTGCHDIIVKSLLPHINKLLENEEFSNDESALFWYSCRYAIHHLLSCNRMHEAERLLLDKKFAKARLKCMGISRAVHTHCWECTAMTELKTMQSSQPYATVESSKPSHEIWRQNCMESICNMSTLLRDNNNSNSLDINVRGLKRELGSCFQLLGESIGSTGEFITEEIKQYERALMFRTEAFGDHQNHESIADTLCEYSVHRHVYITWHH
jgi:hypothetical protein